MEKHLLTIEFRYYQAPKRANDYPDFKSKTITVGVFDSFEDAAKAGNEQLKTLESRYKLHVFPSGMKAKRERFSKNGGAYGSKKNLISNLAYLKTPFEFYAKIGTLYIEPLTSALDEVEETIKEYRKHKKRQDNER